MTTSDHEVKIDCRESKTIAEMSIFCSILFLILLSQSKQPRDLFSKAEIPLLAQVEISRSKMSLISSYLLVFFLFTHKTTETTKQECLKFEE